jgi:hypothetical protein
MHFHGMLSLQWFQRNVLTVNILRNVNGGIDLEMKCITEGSVPGRGVRLHRRSPRACRGVYPRDTAQFSASHPTTLFAMTYRPIAPESAQKA